MKTNQCTASRGQKGQGMRVDCVELKANFLQMIQYQQLTQNS